MTEPGTKEIKNVETLVKEENISAEDWAKSFLNSMGKYEMEHKRSVDHDFIRAWMASAIETAVSATQHKLYSVDDIDVGVDVYENDQKPHLYSIGDIPMYRCPKCDSSSISGDMQDEDQFIYASHECLSCGCEWQDRFDLIRRRITYTEPQTAEEKLAAIQLLIDTDGAELTDGEVLDGVISIIGLRETDG